mmetsp:Transcript_12155/g.31225  ORF Transcript_12155/g.31225 Transcript_12155/m.31225 type:complete len:222 (-) Transcript_12155:48-713(-)
MPLLPARRPPARRPRAWPQVHHRCFSAAASVASLLSRACTQPQVLQQVLLQPRGMPLMCLPTPHRCLLVVTLMAELVLTSGASLPQPLQQASIQPCLPLLRRQAPSMRSLVLEAQLRLPLRLRIPIVAVRTAYPLLLLKMLTAALPTMKPHMRQPTQRSSRPPTALACPPRWLRRWHVCSRHASGRSGSLLSAAWRWRNEHHSSQKSSSASTVRMPHGDQS